MEILEQVSRRLARTQGHFVNGEHVDDTNGASIPVHDPGSGQIISQVAAGSAADIDSAVRAARSAFPAWAAMSADERTRVLLRYADLVEDRAEEFTQLSVLDGGLPWAIGETTAMFCAMFLRYYAGWVTKISGQTLPSGAFGIPPSDLLAYTVREPIGVVGAITPWNYPFGMEILKVAPVLATGCALVLKPAEQAPVASTLLAELALEAGVPPGVFNVVNGAGETAGAALAAHSDVDKIAFTGSTEVGRLIVNASSGNLKRVSLELGGKSPVVIFPDADLETAIPGAAMAAFAMSGQNCVCGSRLFVHESIAGDVAEGIGQVANALPVGPGADPANAIGPVISARQLDRIEGYIAAAKDQGAHLVAGGSRVGDSGYFIQPTLFSDCTPENSIVREEIFGPVIAMQTFGDGELEALAESLNDTTYGLSGSVWTRDLATANRMVKLIDSGQVGVNCHAAMDPSMPFGGNKQSGWGREFGQEGLDLYLKTKAVTMAWSGGQAPWNQAPSAET